MTGPDAVARARAAVDRLVRDVADFPEPGVVFKDIAPLLRDADGLADVVAGLAEVARSRGPVDVVAGVEARGFVLAAPVAVALGVGLVPVRKAGKLPGRTERVSYSLEYGEATLEVQDDAFTAGDRVLVIDDVLATGGTLRATRELVERGGGVVSACAVLLELSFLGGREVIGDLAVEALRVV